MQFDVSFFFLQCKVIMLLAKGWTSLCHLSNTDLLMQHFRAIAELAGKEKHHSTH